MSVDDNDPDGDAGPTESDRLGIDQHETLPSWDSSKDRATYLIAEYKLIISLALGAGTLVLASGFWQIPALPPTATIALKWFAIGILPATIVAQKTIVSWFVPDNRYRVLVLNPEQGVEARDVAVPRRHWTSREHEAGRPALTPSRGNIDAVVRTFTYDESTDTVRVEGCNPEIANPVDVTTTDSKISQIYETLLDSREELRDLRATMDSRIMQIQDMNLNAVMASLEKGLAVNPEDGRDLIREDSTDDVSRPLSTSVDRDEQDDDHDRDDHDRDLEHDDDLDLDDEQDDDLDLDDEPQVDDPPLPSAGDEPATGVEDLVAEVAANPDDMLGDEPARTDGGEE